MTRTRTTKSLASRIELDYYRRVHPLRRWRKQLAAAAFIVPFAGLFASAKFGDESEWSPGRVAPSHAAIASDCRSCHGAEGTVTDLACSRCHEGELHVPGNDPAASECASCHRDHRADRLGSDALSRIDDAHCVRCHATAQRTIAGQQRIDAVSSFASHPEFDVHREQRPDPGTIRLNHQLHLTLDIPGRSRNLACADCHALDATGKRMRPIAYEEHCADCHSLELTGALAGATVPHGLAPTDLREELTHLALARALRGESNSIAPETPSSTPPPSPLIRDRSRSAAAADPAVQAWLAATVAESEQFLAATRCAECHSVERSASGGLASIAPAGVPSSWFPGARFDHHAHRATACAECHHDVAASRETADRHLPRLADCARCHGDRENPRAPPQARGDCVECHAYHPHRETMRDGR